MTLYRPNGNFGPVCDPHEEITDDSLPIIFDATVLANPNVVTVDLDGQSVTTLGCTNPADYRPKGSMGPVCDPPPTRSSNGEPCVDADGNIPGGIGSTDPSVVNPVVPAGANDPSAPGGDGDGSGTAPGSGPGGTNPGGPASGGPGGGPGDGAPPYSGPTEPYRPDGDFGPVCDPFVPYNLNPEPIRFDEDGLDGDGGPEDRPDELDLVNPQPAPTVKPTAVVVPDYRPNGPFGPVCDPFNLPPEEDLGGITDDDFDPDLVYPDAIQFPNGINFITQPNSAPTIGLPTTDKFEDGIDIPSVAGIAFKYDTFWGTSDINQIPSSFTFNDPDPDKGDWDWAEYYYNGKFFEWDKTPLRDDKTGLEIYENIIDIVKKDPDRRGDSEAFNPDTYCSEPWPDFVLDPYIDTDGNTVYRQVKSSPRTFQVAHDSFSAEFAQKSAWISQGICSFEGNTRLKNNAANFTSKIVIPDTDTYKIRHKFYKGGEIFLDYYDTELPTQQLLTLTEGQASYSGNGFSVVEADIDAGTYDITVFIENYTQGTYKPHWKDSPAACAIEIYQGDFSIQRGEIPCDVGILESSIPGSATFASNGDLVVTGTCTVKFDFSYNDNPNTYGTALGTVAYNQINVSFTQDTSRSKGNDTVTRTMTAGTYQITLSSQNSAGFVRQNNNTELCFRDGDGTDCNALLKLKTLDSTIAGEGITITCGTEAEVKLGLRYDDDPDTVGLCLSSATWTGSGVTLVRDTNKENGTRNVTADIPSGTYAFQIFDNAGGYNITNAGSGYSETNGLATSTSGSGSGMTIDITEVTGSNNRIFRFEVNNPGSGYTQGDTISILGGGGSGGQLTVGSGYTIVNPGSISNDSHIILYDGGGTDENGRLTCELLNATGPNVTASFDSNGNLVIGGTTGYTNTYVRGLTDDSSVWSQSDVGTEITFTATDPSKGMVCEIGIVPRNDNSVGFRIVTDWAVKSISNYGSGYSVDDTFDVSYTKPGGGTVSAKVKIFSTRRGQFTTGNLIWSTTDNAVGYNESFTPFDD